MRTRASPNFRPLFIGAAGLLALALAACIAMGVLGTISFFRAGPAPLPGFRRDFAPNCNDVFFCVNATDPNPSYVQFKVPPLAPTFNEYQFLQGGVFDISGPEAVVLAEDGVYLFTGFFSFLTAAPEEIAVLITAGNETLLTAPVVDGTLTVTAPFDLLSNATVAVGRFATTARMSGGTVLRVGVVVSGDAFIAPGGHWAGVQISKI